jgi:outer membrane scaffolding protein for murein synthesis (MipA/OmpV family)
MKILPSLVLLMLAGIANAQDHPLPKLELGVGLLALDASDFPGSGNRSSYLLPIPYARYRGKRLRIDDGAQGVLLESSDLLITLSGDLSLPTDEDTPEREGMDDLQATFEVGPSLNYRFHAMQESAWWLDLPLRFAYTLDSDLDYVGAVFQPRLSWRKPEKQIGDWKFRFNTGPIFASASYNDYYYAVGSSDVTESRPEYESESGYSGWRNEFSTSKRIDRYRLGAFLRYNNLGNSVIDDSPLVSKTDSWGVGIALIWVFHER